MADFRWTPQQAAAIAEQRHTLLVANAGTGKTATVVGKIRWLLGLQVEPARAVAGSPPADEPDAVPVPPCEEPCELREIAAITFTEKAAYDLQRKLREGIMQSERADELRWQIDRASIGTIHSFCGELLREHALRLGIDPTFRVLDERESWTAQDDLILELVKDALAEGDEGASLLLKNRKLTSTTYTNGVVDYVRKAMYDLRWHPECYDRWTDEGGRLQESALRRLAGDWEEDKDTPSLREVEALVGLAGRALGRWNEYLLEENVRDFDALILDTRKLLTGKAAAAALEGIRRRYRVLIIDEFQDTDSAQRDIAFAIAGLSTGEPGEARPAPSGSSGAAEARGARPDSSGVAGRAAGSPPGVSRPQLFLVGDPKQSIYRFRGADISVWNEVAKSLGRQGVVLELSRNFRCAPPIVDFVNAACATAMRQVGEEIEKQGLGSRIEYSDLVAGVEPVGTARLEWLVAERRKEKKSGEVSVYADLEAEAEQVAVRIREMVGEEEIHDPDTGTVRPVRPRDIAVLYRARTLLPRFEAALSRHAIPYTIAGAPHLGDRQEILDLLNLLRLLRNPRDDYRAFGFLRSPFVGLRDEVLAHVALNIRGGSLLRKARNYLDGGEWFDGPEGEAVSAIERAALERGLDTLEEARALVHRAPLDEVLQLVLERLGYRLHLLVRGRAEEELANIQSFLQFTEAYRDHDISTFLQVWDRFDAQDNGLPQAPLYSKDDDIVTLTTIHRAKGLEWPVVFLVGTGGQRSDRMSNQYWTDPDLGPILCPSQDDRGKRAWRLWRRNEAEDHAEDSRLLYVAATRARDRLLIVGPYHRERSYSEWLASGVKESPIHIRRETPETAAAVELPRPELGWLSRLRIGPPPSLVAPLPDPPPRFVVSATELMGRARDESTWRLRYRHGVQPKWEFAGPFEEGTLERAPSGGSDAGGGERAEGEQAPVEVPATVRGTVIHGVLERIRHESELSRLLRETIGGLDDPDLEEALMESEYRDVLEEEIRRVVSSEEWAWYVSGEHYRELEFVHLAGPREWRVGAFDLYRPGDGSGHPLDGAGNAAAGTGTSWVIDFKTHEIDADEAEEVAGDYEIQVRVYREAAAVRDEARVALHFTGPNVVVEPEEG